MPRVKNTPNYNKFLLYDCIKKIKPANSKEWNTVATLYKKESNESEERASNSIKTYWRKVMCCNGEFIILESFKFIL